MFVTVTNHCQCGAPLPSVPPDQRPPEFCSPECKAAARMEADLLVEDLTGAPVNYGSTAKAIAALEKRIAYLNNLIAQAVAEPVTLAQEKRQAEADLARYRAQDQGRN